MFWEPVWYASGSGFTFLSQARRPWRLAYSSLTPLVPVNCVSLLPFHPSSSLQFKLPQIPSFPPPLPFMVGCQQSRAKQLKMADLKMTRKYSWIQVMMNFISFHILLTVSHHSPICAFQMCGKKTSLSISSQHDQNSIPANLYIMHLFLSTQEGCLLVFQNNSESGLGTCQSFKQLLEKDTTALKVVDSCYVWSMAQP